MKKIYMTLMVVALCFIGCNSEQKPLSSMPTVALPATLYASVAPLVGQKAMLLEFGSTSCASCVEMGKLLRKVKDEHPSAHIYFIEVYADQQAMRNYGIQMIPTQVYLNDKGEETDRHIGALNYEQLIAKLKSEKII